MTTVKRVKGAAVERRGLVEEAEVKELALQLEEKGYAWLEKEPAPAGVSR